MSAADELVDVIDDVGDTIAVVTRREMRARRLPHRCTYVLVFNARGELFIHQRTSTKDVYPSYWDVCIGGVLAAGESFNDGVKREIREELGIDADPESLFPIHYRDDATFAHGMAYRLDHDGPFLLQAEEIVRGEFAPVAEVLERIRREPYCPDGVQVLRQYLGRATDPVRETASVRHFAGT
jgi:isopentenyldiphosphate isomerase